MEINDDDCACASKICSQCHARISYPIHCLKCQSLFCSNCTYKTFALCFLCFRRLPEQTGTVADILEMQRGEDEDHLNLTARLLRAVGEFRRCGFCHIPTTDDRRAIGDVIICDICDESQQILCQPIDELEERITDTFSIFSKKRKLDHRKVYMTVQANDASYVMSGDPESPGPPVGTGNPYRLTH